MTNALLQPEYWLVIGLAWPDGSAPTRDAAFAVAPPLIPRARVSSDARDILAVADAYQRALPGRVLLFSDLTRWLAGNDSNWAARGTDWEAAIDELTERNPAPGMYVRISQRAHIVICDATREGMTLHYADGGSERLRPEERVLVREALADRLSEDWPRYVAELTDSGGFDEA
ncbi:MAG TPA: hypothetical protein VLH10_18395 [Yinghuangia sp.]|uniref:hypothetical protein n=1 Tax=Yinghuangia sp. YIM S10712 TaxID=3436930 RepID=UPI002CF95012|nr:hypothetical protein [Yinghuangia sp.]